MSETEAILEELRRIRVTLERSSNRIEPVAYSYEQAAQALGCSKRSIERLVSLGRLKPRDIGGPKIPASQLRNLADGETRAVSPRAHSKPAASADVTRENQETMARVRALVRRHQQEGSDE